MTSSRFDGQDSWNKEEQIDSPFQDETFFAEEETDYAARVMRDRLVNHEDESPFMRAFVDEEKQVEQPQQEQEDTETYYSPQEELEESELEESSQLEVEYEQPEFSSPEQEGYGNQEDYWNEYDAPEDEEDREQFTDEASYYADEHDESEREEYNIAEVGQEEYEDQEEWNEYYAPNNAESENQEAFIAEANFSAEGQEEAEHPVDWNHQGPEPYQEDEGYEEFTDETAASVYEADPESGLNSQEQVHTFESESSVSDYEEESYEESESEYGLERISPEYELAGLIAEETGINPNDPRIDVRAKFALSRMLKRADTKTDAARLVQGINSGQLAGIYGDDLRAAVNVAKKHNTQRWLLVPKGEDAVLVLEPTNSLTAPPTVVFRGDTPDISKQPQRLDAALKKVSRTYLLWLHRKIGTCGHGSAIPIPNMIPKNLCRIVKHDLRVHVTTKGKALPGAMVQVIGPKPSPKSIRKLTDNDGNVSFATLESGAYQVSVNKKGFRKNSKLIYHPQKTVPLSHFIIENQQIDSQPPPVPFDLPPLSTSICQGASKKPQKITHGNATFWVCDDINPKYFNRGPGCENLAYLNRRDISIKYNEKIIFHTGEDRRKKAENKITPAWEFDARVEMSHKFNKFNFSTWEHGFIQKVINYEWICIYSDGHKVTFTVNNCRDTVSKNSVRPPWYASYHPDGPVADGPVTFDNDKFPRIADDPQLWIKARRGKSQICKVEAQGNFVTWLIAKEAAAQLTHSNIVFLHHIEITYSRCWYHDPNDSSLVNWVHTGSQQINNNGTGKGVQNPILTAPVANQNMLRQISKGNCVRCPVPNP